LFEHWPKAKILKRGRFIDYPLRGLKVISSLPPWRLPAAILSFLGARTRMFLGRPGPDDSFRGWITNRFGRLLFGEYFGPYAEKVWGIPSGEIDRYVAEKRVPVISLTELIRSAVFGRIAGANHPEFLDHNYYLRHGIGETVGLFERENAAAGVHTLFNVELESVTSAGERVESVRFRTREGMRTLAADFLLSTIPLNALVSLFSGVPPGVVAAAGALDYCASVLVFIRVSRESVLPSSMLYFSDPSVRFSRIYDVGMYSRSMVPAGKTMLCIEFPCSVGDEVWTASDDSLAAEALRDLVGHGVLRPGDAEGWHTERISHSYPRFRVGFQERVAACIGFLRSFGNLLSYGRQGSFAYLNTDGVMNQGFKAASAVLLAEPTRYSCWEWFESK
jgi:protoporphyrinogen oxidase